MRWVIGAAILVGLVFGLTQVIIPNIAEGDVEDRLTQDGGEATVNVRAIPALRLLFGSGDVLTVDARDISIPVAGLRDASFQDLDKFDEVDVTMVDSTVGPIEARRIELNKGEGEDEYAFVFRGSTSADQLADFVLSALPAGLRSIAEAIAGRASTSQVPVRLDAVLRSQNGQARLVSGSGDLAGIPLGPIAVRIAGAVISRVTG